MTTSGLAPASVESAGNAGQMFPYGVGSRGFFLLALGLLLMLPAWMDRRTLLVLAAWDLLVAIAWSVDLLRLPAVSDLVVQRRWHGALGLGTPACVTLDLSNRGDVAIHALLTDRPESSLRTRPARCAATVEARQTVSVEYDVRPTERGDVTAGIVTVRYESSWRLAVRWASVPLEQTVLVYPNIDDAGRHALAVIRSAQIVLDKRRARHRGLGREFESLREHQDGDEPRDICWTATARRGRLITKRYRPERSQTVWILVDAGRLLRGQIAGQTKLDHAVNATLALANVVQLSGDRVGILAYGRRPLQRLKPARGAAHVRQLVEALARVGAEDVEADHARAAGLVLAMQTRRSLIVWLTELSETAGLPDVVEQSQRMTGRHLVLMAVPRQTDLAAVAGNVPERPEAMYRMMAAQETLERREALLGALRGRGVVAVEWSAGQLSTALVDQYLAIKEQGRL